MTMSEASDAQFGDLGAIEAALKETARGRAFLADYARRVQQSDTLTILAMLGRLERVSDDLASRLAELEGAEVPLYSEPALSAAARSQPGGALGGRLSTVPEGGGHPVSGTADARRSSPSHASNGETMGRVGDLADLLAALDRQAAHLAPRCGKADARHGPATSLENAVRPQSTSQQASRSSRPAGEQDLSDEDVLDEIAKALGPTT
jgi:hypothetical protein